MVRAQCACKRENVLGVCHLMKGLRLRFFDAVLHSFASDFASRSKLGIYVAALNKYISSALRK